MMKSTSISQIARMALGGLLLLLMVLTPGFFSLPSLMATADYLSILGLVAIGMSFITISGNVMSLALSITMASCGEIFLLSTQHGLLIAIIITLFFGVIICWIQGFIIGTIRANPIIVSIAAMALINGIVSLISGGVRIYPDPIVDINPLRIKYGIFNIALIIFIFGILFAQFIFSFTQFGRNIFFIGSNFRAAKAAGIKCWLTISNSYGFAGFFTAIAGILAAARYQSADLELGTGYDFESIASILIGGVAIQGGKGSGFKVLLGGLIFSAVGTLLVLRGYSTEIQKLLTGILIFTVICLQFGENRK